MTHHHPVQQESETKQDDEAGKINKYNVRNNKCKTTLLNHMNFRFLK